MADRFATSIDARYGTRLKADVASVSDRAGSSFPETRSSGTIDRRNALLRARCGIAMAKIENEQIVETTVEARGAERGPTVRNVLVVSLCLVVVAFAILYFVAFRH